MEVENKDKDWAKNFILGKLLHNLISCRYRHAVYENLKILKIGFKLSELS
jgi:hypothetical protein